LRLDIEKESKKKQKNSSTVSFYGFKITHLELSRPFAKYTPIVNGGV